MPGRLAENVSSGASSLCEAAIPSSHCRRLLVTGASAAGQGCLAPTAPEWGVTSLPSPPFLTLHLQNVALLGSALERVHPAFMESGSPRSASEGELNKCLGRCH